jgi:CDK inhibitor PHO81
VSIQLQIGDEADDRLRVYGHEFLAQRCLVQLSLGHPFQRTTPTSSAKPPPVKLYSRSGQESLNLWSSLKLVMTSKSDISAVPHSVILPLADEREVFSFQVSDLTRFTLELSLYPTFGSKVIGRAVILPSTFLDIRYHKGFIVPLLDTQLKTIGEVAFEVSCIRPFVEAQLEIGGRVETYWKSKVTPSSQAQDHAHGHTLAGGHGPLSIGSSSPAAARAPVQSTAAKESALVTASSLSGEYVEVVVQVTKDGVAVVYPEYTLPIPGLEIGVADVSYAQFASLAQSTGRTFTPPQSSAAPEWYTAISHALVSLEDLLEVVPTEIGLNVQLKYVRASDSKRYKVGKSYEVNEFVDPVLHRIYEAGRRAAAAATPTQAGTGAVEGAASAPTGRKIILSSFDPTVCTALNWKQPNCESSQRIPSRILAHTSRGLLRFVLRHLAHKVRY